MVSKLALIRNILLASAALASPFSHRRARLTRGEDQQSQPEDLVESHAGKASKDVEYYNTWAGVIWNDGVGAFTTATGTFTVPTISGKNGAAISIWVGIDGDTTGCTDAIWQAGVDVTVSRHGRLSCTAWYEWYPVEAYYWPLSHFKISTGDDIRVTVISWSAHAGTAIMENLTTGKTVSKYYESRDNALCGESAEWIIEDFDTDGVTVPLADFGTVTFTNATARGSDPYRTLHNARVVNMQRKNGEMLTSVSIDDDSGDIYIKHV